MDCFGALTAVAGVPPGRLKPAKLFEFFDIFATAMPEDPADVAEKAQAKPETKEKPVEWVLEKLNLETFDEAMDSEDAWMVALYSGQTI